ncbi:hypothetical protein [Sulfoacidibacillus thermotolerans]|uniref:Uncharacterized protein n=1 Tax=Sulfoacidibacillus thermotolerans TaxID=1765684 RepID=A0A2U3CVT2_SULT2|nr:hypothetical protein [Sulfoacidibacillus thermotolerans]PWI53141.1 hypothetical protein BM613_13975 [Sulfoacidibacillus thermotolerans]
MSYEGCANCGCRFSEFQISEFVDPFDNRFKESELVCAQCGETWEPTTFCELCDEPVDACTCHLAIVANC